MLNILCGLDCVYKNNNLDFLIMTKKFNFGFGFEHCLNKVFQSLHEYSLHWAFNFGFDFEHCLNQLFQFLHDHHGGN